MAGLVGQPTSLHIAVGSTIDVHLNPGYGGVVSSNPAVIHPVGIFGWLSSTTSFKAISVGTAELTTTASGIWGCAQITPSASGETVSQQKGKDCPVLAVAVSSS
jgi:hypothetical protein